MQLKLIGSLICGLIITTTLHAATTGTYVGGGAGYGNSGVFLNLSHDKKDHGGFGATLFTGFNLNQYFGIEGGYVLFPQATYVYRPLFSKPTNEKSTYDVSALYLMPKAYLPIGACHLFNLFAGLGGAQAFTKFQSPYKTKRNNTFVVAAAIGATYQFTNNMTASIEALTMTNGNKSSDAFKVPSSDLLSLNLIYNF